MKIRKSEKGAELIVKDEVVEELNPTQLLELSGKLKDFVLQNADDFKADPIRKVNFRGREFLVSVSSNFGFWEMLESGEWEPQTFEVFDKFIDEQTTFLDIGGWIGSTALYGAQLADQTLVFEPDSAARVELQRNVNLNLEEGILDKVTVFPHAIAPESGRVELGFRTGSGDSMSSVLLYSENTTTVESVSLDQIIAEHGLNEKRLFIKMDVEGFEYDILSSLGDLTDKLKNATFFISFHPQFLLEKLRKDERSEAQVRAQFFNIHKVVFKVFKNYRSTYINGNPFKFKKEMAKSLITGQFPREVIFTSR